MFVGVKILLITFLSWSLLFILIFDGMKAASTTPEISFIHLLGEKEYKHNQIVIQSQTYCFIPITASSVYRDTIHNAILVASPMIRYLLMK